MRQALAEQMGQAQGILFDLMSQMQINHGRIDLLVAQQRLDVLEAGPHFQEMGGVGMPLMPSSALEAKCRVLGNAELDHVPP